MLDDNTPEIESPEIENDVEVPREKRSIEEFPPEAQEAIRALRAENAARRVKNKALEDQIAAAKEAELEKNAEWQQLAEERAAKIAELARDKERLEQLENAAAVSNGQRIEALPDEWRAIVPMYDDALQLEKWLDAAEKKVISSRPPVVPTGAGELGDRQPVVKLTPEQKEMARKFKLTDEEYAEGLR
jgi:DNA repair exonuclease SbcCD ATPase subunit